MSTTMACGANLINSLNETLIHLHRHPYPHVSNPPDCHKRASVALILRIRPRYGHWPETPLPALDKASSVSQQVDEFFAQDWVQQGDPEALFIKRASRSGDRWTGHVALPGGKRDPEDDDDLAAAVRETAEEIGLDLTADEYLFVANLPERVVTTSWDSIPSVAFPLHPLQC
jgi:8-oxo-dGTP pyrophosphatase MutT (NUDIX family)